ncbi:MAG: Crp/Fnr family transcriptional regulator [Alphaproteobacteria bacterium]|nr:Crp/Fnr family transcriptional regulator [Alphaproteobacteria bacterium]
MGSLTYIAPDQASSARLRRMPPFSALRPEQIAALQAAARLASAEPGTVLPATGPAGRVLYVILEGSVALMREVGPEQRCLVDVCDGPCLVGEVALFDDRGLGVVVEVLQRVMLFELPASAVLRCLRDNTAAQLRMLGYMSGRLKRLIIQIANLKLMTGPQRLAHFLTVLSERRTGPEAYAAGTVQLPFEKQTLAALLGMTPESLSRAFRRLDALGVRNLAGGEIKIPDVELLRQFAEPDVATSSDG